MDTHYTHILIQQQRCEDEIQGNKVTDVTSLLRLCFIYLIKGQFNKKNVKRETCDSVLVAEWLH